MTPKNGSRRSERTGGGEQDGHEAAGTRNGSDRRLLSRSSTHATDLWRDSANVVAEQVRVILRHPATRVVPLALLLVWAPLPFASVTPRAAAGLGVATLLALGATLALARRVRLTHAQRLVFASLAGVVLLAALQTVRLPLGVAAHLGPAAARLAKENAEIGAPADGVALSLAPDATRAALKSWLAVAAAFAAGSVAGASRRARRSLLAALAAAGVFEVFFGAQLWFARSDRIWGLRVPGPTNRLRGTFVNANHLATYLAILSAIALAWLWWSLRRARREEEIELRIRIAAPPALVWLVLFVGLAFTGSRAGLIAALAGALAQATLILAHRGRRAVVAGMVATVALAVGSVALFGFQAGFGRLLATGVSDGSVQVRRLAVERTLELWQQAPWTGVGLGAFRAAFPRVQDASIPDVWWHAHNGWAEMLATGGLVGVGLLVVGLVAVGRGLAVAWRRGERSEDRAAALAAIGALVAVGIQELADFGITMPANGVTLAVLCGAALAVAQRTAPPAST